MVFNYPNKMMAQAFVSYCLFIHIFLVFNDIKLNIEYCCCASSMCKVVRIKDLRIKVSLA